MNVTSLGTSISSSNSSSAASSSNTTPTRPRHHNRSFSSDRQINGRAESPSSTMALHLPTRNRRTSSNGNGPITPPISASNSAAATPIASSSKLAGATTTTIVSASAIDLPHIKDDKRTSSSIQSNSPSKKEPSPPRKSLSIAEQAEQDQLNRLRQAQASKRPRVMRMTPAFSSLPGRMHGDAPLKMMSSTSTDDNSSSLEFPQKGNESNESNPAHGLQIDLNCIPTPSLVDLEGPITTSKIENMVRDRNGNPIKPAMKSSRTSMSHFLPGRTTRSDSTPTLPQGYGSKSVPTTPTVPKNVHFDSNLEHVKMFKFKQRPSAVSRDGSPEQTETETEEEKDLFPYIWKKNSNSPSAENSPTSPTRAKGSPAPVEEQLVLRLPNFPSSTRLSVDREVFLERIYLADDLRSVKGTIQVRNLSFEKWVAVRYSLDHWATIGEVSAEFSESVKGGQADRFTFSIKLNELLNWPRGSAAHETKSMYICLRYRSSTSEYWDNNEGQNYQLDFRRRPVPTTPASTPMASGPLRAVIVDPNVSTAKSRVLEIARRGVGGKGVFAMEDLKRELEKLRSDDEEDDISRPTLLSTVETTRKKSSPPISPNGRASSPSVWTARYDFGQSLRNPRSGSRSSDQGRAAALDYFSAKSMGSSNATPILKNSSNNNTASPAPPSFLFSAASPPPAKSVEKFTASSFNARFGMISPGLNDNVVEHLPVNAGTTSTATPSPTATPTMASQPLSRGSSGSGGQRTPPDRFNSFPPSRNVTSPGITYEVDHLNPSRNSSIRHRSSVEILRNNSENGQEQNQANEATKHYKYGSSSSTEESNQSSPHSTPPSDGGSPNPFSPSMSVSSMESDATISPNILLSKPPAHARKNGSLMKTVLQQQRPSQSHQDEEEQEAPLRPASMSDYQELVNRFCWNHDLVPSGGSMVPDMPVNGGLGKSNLIIDGQPMVSPVINKVFQGKSPAGSASGSGASTPTMS